MLDPDRPEAQQIHVAGFFLLAAGDAFVHLRILGGDDIASLLSGVEPTGHYAYRRFHTLLTAVRRRFRDFDPVLERLGVEMMRGWYEMGPGRSLVKSGVEFLRFQTGSEGYRSVVSGPPETIGEFALEALDEGKGAARVRSSTPFPRAMEKGVLVGGMRAPGDLVYVEVETPADASVFEIRFH